MDERTDARMDKLIKYWTNEWMKEGLNFYN